MSYTYAETSHGSMGCILSDVSWDQLGVSGLTTLYTLIQVTQLGLIKP